MTIFDFLSMLGGLALFLFGMNIMGDSLERSAGKSLKSLIGKLTNNPFASFFTGLAVTAIIQSSSATTVMVVGFVNSGVMTLKQSIGIIMGANIGTTVTAWVLSLSGISGDNIVLQLLKPTSFTPVLAVLGIALFMLSKSSKRKDVGTIFLGFATLMFGMDTMSSSVAGLADVPAFQNLFLIFKNPILGVLAGIIVTAIIQSSSASVGILQALTVTGQISYGAAIPIIMGQNIGTCVTALLSSVGTNRNAKRTAVIHLSFNILGTAVWLLLFSILSAIFKPPLLDAPASYLGIAIAHSAFNILCTLLLFPAASLLEKLAIKLVPDAKYAEPVCELDERLLTTPSIAIERCEHLLNTMASEAQISFEESINILLSGNLKEAQKIRDAEESTDHYEDILGTYLIKLSNYHISDRDSATISKLLKAIGDFERIADHSVNILESSEELLQKQISFSQGAKKELEIMCTATKEIVELSKLAIITGDTDTALNIEPLEQIIDEMKEYLRDRHILRLQDGSCTVDAGFIWSDILTNLERIADHCSNIAACIIDSENNNMNLHKSVREMKEDSKFELTYSHYKNKYHLTM